MNEHIDTASKLTTKDYPVAHLTTQAVSMGYNVSMLWYYNYLLAMAKVIGSGYLSAEQIQVMRSDSISAIAGNCWVVYGGDSHYEM